MRAGQVAERAGVNVETLRYYERRGLLPTPDRDPSGHRRYDEDTLRLVRAIKEAQSLFVRDTKETHKAATRYFGYIKYKPAFRMLAEKLDEPHPKNPNDPNNPPESYWKERWQEWDSNVPHTRWALSQLVEGETFELAAEAKEWAEKHGKEHGIEW